MKKIEKETSNELWMKYIEDSCHHIILGKTIPLCKNLKNKTQFKDLLGRHIYIGDNVIHLWFRIDGRGRHMGGKSGVNYKIATVIKQTKKGISIEWRDKHNKIKVKKSTIFNTTNRLIVLDGESLSLHYEDIVNDVVKSHSTYKKRISTQIKKLKKDIAFYKEQLDIISSENLALKKDIKSFTANIERFNLLDL